MGKVNSPGGSCCADDCLIEEYSFAQNNTTGTIAGWEKITGVAQILDNALVLDDGARIYAKDYTVQHGTPYIKFQMYAGTGVVAGIELPNPSMNVGSFSGLRIEFTINGASSKIKFMAINGGVIYETYEGTIPCYPNDNILINSAQWFTVEICYAAQVTAGFAGYANVYITPEGGLTRRFSYNNWGEQLTSQTGFFSAAGQVKFRNYERWQSNYGYDPNVVPAGIHNPGSLIYYSCKPCHDCYFQGFGYLSGYQPTQAYFDQIFETKRGSYQALTNPNTGHQYISSSYGLFIHKEETARSSNVIAQLIFEYKLNNEPPPFKARLVFDYRESDGNYWYVEYNPYELESSSDLVDVWKLRRAFGNTIDGVIYETTDGHYYQCKPDGIAIYVCEILQMISVHVLDCFVRVYLGQYLSRQPYWCFKDQNIFETGRWGFEIVESTNPVGIWSFDGGCWRDPFGCVTSFPEQPPTEDPTLPDPPDPPDPVGCCDGAGSLFNGSTLEAQLWNFNFDIDCASDPCILLNSWFFDFFLARHTLNLIYKSPTEMWFQGSMQTTNPCAACNGEPDLHMDVKIKKISDTECEVTGQVFSYTCEGCTYFYRGVVFETGRDCQGMTIFYDGPDSNICCLNPRDSAMVLYFV